METITITGPATCKSGPGATMEIHVPDYSVVSDGFHTIEELYDHRITLYIALCRFYETYRGPSTWNTEAGRKHRAWRAKVHHDGTKYEGWFLLAIGTEPGKQISYHIPLSRWDETGFATTYDRAPVPFDGHTSADVVERLKTL